MKGVIKMNKYLVGAIGGIIGMLALKVAYRKGVKDGVKFAKGLVDLINDEDEEES